MNPEQIGLWAGLILSLMIFSYLLGDNFLYRLAVHIFAGLSAGFITVVVLESVVLPWLNTRVLPPEVPVGERLVAALPFFLGLLLLFKTSPRLGRLGNLAVALMVAVGTAVAMVGAISGTLLPLSNSVSADMAGNPLNGFIIMLGVISTLVYFQYLARRLPNGETQRSLFSRVFGAVGQAFIVITLGALYGGAILTGLTVFSERLAFIIGRIIGG